MITSHKLVNAEDVIDSLRNAIEELDLKDNEVVEKLTRRADELLGEVSRTKSLEKEEKIKEEAKKPYCSKEWVILVHDEDGSLLSKPIEGYVFQKCLATKKPGTPPDAEYAEEDWPIDQAGARLNAYIDHEHKYSVKGRCRMFLDEYMEKGKKATLKKFGLDRKSKFSAHIIPVSLPVLKEISEDLARVEIKIKK